MKIRNKIGIGYLLILCIIIPAFYGMTVHEHNEILNKDIVTHIENFKASFSVLIERDIQKLASGLEIVIQDPGIKERFLSNNREALFRYGEPLFKNLKEKYGITHFYFILPDGHCFLRLHNKNIYGDMINRHTFLKARETQGLASGIELGKTAFALRAVMPYYHEGRLIGYVELGEEIDHFLEIMKKQTGDEYAIVADKIKLNREDWRSLRAVAGLRDNWNERENHLLVSETINDGFLNKCINEEAIKKAEKGEGELHKFNNESSSYICTGFGISDASGVHVGAVLSPVNITHFTIGMKKFNTNSMVFLGIILLVSTIGVVVFSASITRPLSRLEDAAKMMEEGNLDTKADIKSNDEVGMLARAFNNMAVKLRTSISRLEEDIIERKKTETDLRQAEEKYHSLVDCTSDSIYLVDADCKYLFINRQHLLRLGLSEGQYKNKAYSEFHSSEETELFIQKAAQVFKSGESLQYEYKSFRDGKYFLQTISPVKDLNNKTISATVISKDITMLKQTEERLFSLSMTDGLTGLYNRRGFLALVEQQLKFANREDKKMFLMSADLDYLKIINDNMGHQKGDMAIINLANILKETFRESDIVARMGGDEFVVFGADTPDTNIEILAERLRGNLKTHNDNVNEPLGELSLSYGFTVYDPKHPRSIYELLSEADELMYQHKRRTR